MINVNLLPWRDDKRKTEKRNLLVGALFSSVVTIAVCIALFIR